MTHQFSPLNQEYPLEHSAIKVSIFDGHRLYAVHVHIFTCVSYAEARNRYRLDVRPSVRLSVTRWHCIKTAEYIVILSSPHDSPFILVLCISRSSRNSDGVTHSGGAKYRWGIKLRDFLQISRYISQTIQDIAMVAMEGEQELIRDLSNGAISNDLE